MGDPDKASPTVDALGAWQYELLNQLDIRVPELIGGKGTPTSKGRQLASSDVLTKIGNQTFMNFPDIYGKSGPNATERAIADRNFDNLPGRRAPLNPNQSLEPV